MRTMAAALALAMANAWLAVGVAAEIRSRELQPNQFEFVLTHETTLDERVAAAAIAEAAKRVCGTLVPALGKYRFEGREAIGTADAAAGEATGFRFVQEVSCVAAPVVQTSGRRPTLRSAAEAAQVGEMIKARSEAFFRLIAGGQLDEAYRQVSAADVWSDEAKWKADKQAFRETSGEPARIAISKITVYDNPAEAPNPGLYVAADYDNAWRGLAIHCGYLMWFRPVGGEFLITREESGWVTADQLKAMPGEQLPELRRKLRCLEPER